MLGSGVMAADRRNKNQTAIERAYDLYELRGKRRYNWKEKRVDLMLEGVDTYLRNSYLVDHMQKQYNRLQEINLLLQKVGYAETD